MVNRTGVADVANVHLLVGDETNAAFVDEAVRGATAVYVCLRQRPLVSLASKISGPWNAIVQAAAARSARLVVLDDVVRETVPVASAAFAEPRAEGHDNVDMVVGRASHLIGPSMRDVAMADFVFKRAVRNKDAWLVGRPELPHTYHYVPDVGRNLVLLARGADRASGAWNLPSPPTLTTSQLIERVYTNLGRRSKVRVLGRRMVTGIGWASHRARELRADYDRFAAPIVADDAPFRLAFGGQATAWDEIIDVTTSWYLARS
jgi:nucleoside-diphosphate-sugar epimerase